ncbi:MAG: glycosyltransferase family A protein [Acidimicrobiales bacterium]
MTTEPATSQRPAVNVVVATRDRPALLDQTLKAIALQDYCGPIEVVVVYDQTEPDDRIAVDDGDRRVRVIRNGRTSGLQGARNTGIVSSVAPFVAFCDDDDVWKPHKLTAQMDLLDADSRCLMASAGIDVVFEGERLPRIPTNTRVTFADLIGSRMFESTHPSTYLMHRDLFDLVGLVDEDVPGGYGEDYEFILRAARCTDLGAVPEALVEVLWHESSFYAERWQMRIEGLNYLLERHPEFLTDAKGLARIQGQISFAFGALGQKGDAFRTAFETLRLDPLQKRAYLAILMALGVVSPDFLVAKIQRRGRSI